MLKRTARGLIPAAIVAMVLAASWMGPVRGLQFNLATACSYGYLGAPTITGINPTSGTQNGGTSVTITGCGFIGTTGVKFGTTAASFTFVNDSTLTTTSPAGGPGVVDVKVTTAQGPSATVPADQFTYSVAKCTNGQVFSQFSGSAFPGAIIEFDAFATNCPNPTFEFWLQTLDTNWHLMQSWDGNVWDWNTAGYPAGTYTIHAWANETGDSLATPETIGSTTQALTAASGAHCATAGLSPASPTVPAGSSIAFTATSTGCSSPMYEFWVGYPDGVTWQLWRGFSSNPNWTWDTTGLGKGVYHVHVWANQSGDSTATFEALGSSTDTLTGCATAGLSPATATQPAGSSVFFTGSSTGCTNPIYEYWLQDLAGNWNLMRAFSSNPNWNFDSTGRAAGVYNVHMWANQQGGSTATFEQMAASTVTLTACTTAAFTPNPGSTDAGNFITLTGTAATCGTPVFEWWVMYPNGTWNLKQSWGGAVFSWDTSGLTPGTYTVHVWANGQGSDLSSPQNIGSGTVVLHGCLTSTVNNPSAVSGPQGGSFTFTATSTGCGTPVYEWWLQDTAGNWNLVKAFSSGNTWTWNTIGWAKGVYHIHVWANSAGSSQAAPQANGPGFGTFTLT